jgi:hypothetical protein
MVGRRTDKNGGQEWYRWYPQRLKVLNIAKLKRRQCGMADQKQTRALYGGFSLEL